jgi:hypothetical protein
MDWGHGRKQSPVAGRQCRGSHLPRTSALTPCSGGLFPHVYPRFVPRPIDHERAWGNSTWPNVWTILKCFCADIFQIWPHCMGFDAAAPAQVLNSLYGKAHSLLHFSSRGDDRHKWSLNLPMRLIHGSHSSTEKHIDGTMTVGYPIGPYIQLFLYIEMKSLTKSRKKPCPYFHSGNCLHQCFRDLPPGVVRMEILGESRLAASRGNRWSTNSQARRVFTRYAVALLIWSVRTTTVLRTGPRRNTSKPVSVNRGIVCTLLQ